MNVIVFSISTPISSILAAAEKLLYEDEQLLLLTPHLPFENEKYFIESQVFGQLFWRTFEDFLSQEDMIACDQDADELIVNKYGTRDGLIDHYYDKIKELKNNVIISNLRSQFTVTNCYLLAHDLGISPKIWELSGCIDLASAKPTPSPNFYKRLISAYKNKFVFFGKQRSITAFSCNSTTYLFVGKYARVSSFIDSQNVRPIELNLLSYYLLVIVLFLARSNFRASLKAILQKLFDFLVSHISSETIAFLTSVHSYSDALASSSHYLNRDLYCIQDGLIPANYSSRLYKYFKNIKCYFVWDSVSQSVFTDQCIPSIIWEGFEKRVIPLPTVSTLDANKIVLYLASGAGDWTALKNRSDEDYGFLAFYDLARRHPDRRFVFRPHPVWLHPSHQGKNSVQRLLNFYEYAPLPNFYISLPTNNIITNPSYSHYANASQSLNSLIDQSIIVIGDHTDLLISCAQMGKYIVSLNLAKRKSFFYGYSKVGLSLQSSIDELSSFITGLYSSTSFRESYLAGLRHYNSLLG